MRVAIYCRVSTRREEQQNSLGNQIAYALNYAAQNGWTVVDPYIDNGISGGTISKRGEMKRLLADAKRKKFDIVFAKAVSRLARNTREGLQVAFELESLGLRLILPEDNYDTDTSQDTKLPLHLKAMLAEEESRKLSRRFKDGKLTEARLGKYNASIPAFGYRRIEDSGELVIDEQNGSVVRDIFNMFLYKGWGLYRISNYLSEKGTPTPRMVAGARNAGQRWQQSSVKCILENIIYTGTLAQHREEVIDFITRRRKKIDLDQQVIKKDAHPAIITMDEYNTVQERLRTKGKNKSNGQESLFAHIAVCPDCGKGMTFRKDRAKKGGGGYVCIGYVKHGKTFCSSHLIEKDRLIQLVKDDIRELVTNNVKLNNLFASVNREVAANQNDHSNELSQISKKLEQHLNKGLRLVELYSNNSITLEQFTQMNQAMQEEREKLRNRKTELELLLETQKDAESKFRAFKKVLTKVANMDIEDEAVLKQVLQKLIQKIEVHTDGSIKIHYNFARPLSIAMWA